MQRIFPTSETHFYYNKLEEILDIYIPDIWDKDVWIWGLGETTSRYQENLSRLKLGGG